MLPERRPPHCRLHRYQAAGCSRRLRQRHPYRTWAGLTRSTSSSPDDLSAKEFALNPTSLDPSLDQTCASTFRPKAIPYTTIEKINPISPQNGPRDGQLKEIPKSKQLFMDANLRPAKT